MKTIEAIATISANGHIQLSQVEHLPIGKFKVVLVIDESVDSQDLNNSSLSSLKNIAPNYQTSNWDNLTQEIAQKSSLPQQQKLKNLLTSWLKEGDQTEQLETLKVMVETEEMSI
ncbi:hypothetical protein H6G45_17640 [Synechocystis sp. FACHB-383]|uniref:hypothetical protein n=1 Tax=Synechocystis sp. FACHB-383 TaxID=2692864 RepID=UPI001682B0AD|nr:hypothetical protein [Synechocystis sp. FACHB-383]MBD2655272.1 hypothetical protein [Synechocystis sp. FACHB-383]